MPTKEGFKKADTSSWPIISQEKYADMMIQIAAGLLASGHFTQEVDLEYESPGHQALLQNRNYAGFFEPCVLEPAEWVVFNIVEHAGMRVPELPERFEDIEHS